MSSSTTWACTICNKPCTRQCMTCESAAYCSDVCEQTDAALHNLVCRMATILKAPKRQLAGRHSVLAILFPKDSARPQLVMLAYRPGAQNYGRFLGAGDEVVFDVDLGVSSTRGRPRDIADTRASSDNTSSSSTSSSYLVCTTFQLAIIHNNPIRHFPLRAKLALLVDRDDTDDSVNQCLTRLTSYEPRDDTSFQFRGPVVLFRFDPSDTSGALLDDVRLSDLRHAVDYAAIYRNPKGSDLSENNQYLGPGLLVPTVILHCDAKVAHGAKAWESCHFPMGHPALRIPAGPMRHISPVFGRLGIFIAVYKLPTSDTIEWNSRASTLLEDWTNPSSPYWGQPANGLRGDIGNAYALRVDMKALQPWEVHDMIKYISEHFQVLRHEPREDKKLRRKLSLFLTRAYYDRWLEKEKQRRREQHGLGPEPS